VPEIEEPPDCPVGFFSSQGYNSCMASSSEYLTYVLELLRHCDDITYKKMMGEYLLYENGVLFGGVYDDRFLIKKTDGNRGLKEAIPYPGGKVMLLVDSENPDEVRELVHNVIRDIS